MKKMGSKFFDGVLKVVYKIGLSTVLAISRFSSYQATEDGELFEAVYRGYKSQS